MRFSLILQCFDYQDIVKSTHKKCCFLRMKQAKKWQKSIDIER